MRFSIQNAMQSLSRVAFASAGAALMLLSFGLVIVAAVELAQTLRRSMEEAGDALLTAVGYVVIAIAVFDVAKFFIEEKVIRAAETSLLGDRRSTIKFIFTVAIAVFIEGLVIVFQVGKESDDNIVYPIALLLTAIMIVIGLGVFQRLNPHAERRMEQEDRPDL